MKNCGECSEFFCDSCPYPIKKTRGKEHNRGGNVPILIRCPNCQDMVFLSLADWEDFVGDVEPGKDKRVGLTCLQCKANFLMQVALSQVVEQ